MLPVSLRLFRLTFGLVGAAACWASLRMGGAHESLKYFTNQSGILVSSVLIIGGVVMARRDHGLVWNIVRGVAVIAMLVTGIVYLLLLDGPYNPLDGSHPWHQSVLHQLLPIVMLVEILLVPLSRRFPWLGLVTFLIYPIAYCGYWLWRGDQNGWYPYDFMDPRTYDNGMTGVITMIGGLLIAFIVIGAGIIAYSHAVRNRFSSRAPSPY